MGARPMVELVGLTAAGRTLGFGGGFGACFASSRWAFSFLTSSEVNRTVDDFPPKNFSQPGASEKSTFVALPVTLNNVLPCLTFRRNGGG